MLEVVVVLACVSTFLMMLMPAILHGRAAARRIHCQNNLKQIGLALTNYDILYGGFPPGYLFDPEDSTAAGQGFGWSAILLPYLDQAPLAETIVWTEPIDSFENMQLWQHTPPVFMCPSSQASASVHAAFTLLTNDTQVGPSSYAGSFGPGDMWEQPDELGGILGRNSTTRAGEITDGLSHTILVGERFNGIVQMHATGRTLELQTQWPGVVSRPGNRNGEIGHSVLFRAGHVPQSMHADERDSWSAHDEGAQFLMADGAVVQVPFSIDERVYRALSTRAGGELETGQPHVR